MFFKILKCFNSYLSYWKSISLQPQGLSWWSLLVLPPDHPSEQSAPLSPFCTSRLTPMSNAPAMRPFWFCSDFLWTPFLQDVSLIPFQSVLRCSFLNIYLTAIFLIATISPTPSISFLLIMLCFFLIVPSPINTIKSAIEFTYFIVFIPVYSTQWSVNSIKARIFVCFAHLRIFCVHNGAWHKQQTIDKYVLNKFNEGLYTAKPIF